MGFIGKTMPFYDVSFYINNRVDANIVANYNVAPTDDLDSSTDYHCHCAIIPPHLERKVHEFHVSAEGTRGIALQHFEHGKRFRSDRARAVKKIRIGKRKGTGSSQSQTQGESFIVCDAKKRTKLPGTEVRKNSDKQSKDVAANEAYQGAVDTYNFYLTLCKRNSYDGKGGQLLSTVHYDKGYDNAFWDGKQMIYGDGDGKIFNRFTIAPDVTGHEITHGFTQYISSLVYETQSGANNEHISDVFGLCVKYWAADQRNDTAVKVDGLIGAGLIKDVNGKPQALRSFEAPGTAYDTPELGKDPQPGTMDTYQNLPLSEDDGGVHINSGIPNHAFWIVYSEINQRKDGGDKFYGDARVIWWDAVHRITSKADFKALADQTTKSAQVLFGPDSIQANAVLKAWNDTKVTIYK